ncbi:MAG TPA: hypothetical protein VK816_02820 [Jatrophihabitantaceae bacterium]|nr:hypothetical protein [Jatrophihabitantaceae bacterium]
MKLVAGTRLRSQTCTTEVVVVRGADIADELACGGAPLVPIDTPMSGSPKPEAGLDTGTLIGKRYTDGQDLEVLVTKAGDGTLTVGVEPLAVKGSRPLPSSD